MSILKLMDNLMTNLVPSFLIGSSSFFILLGNKDNHKSLDELEFQVETNSDWS